MRTFSDVVERHRQDMILAELAKKSRSPSAEPMPTRIEVALIPLDPRVQFVQQIRNTIRSRLRRGR